MKRRNVHFITMLVFLVFVSITTLVQEKHLVDSLKTLIINGKEDTLKAKHLNDLVWYIKFSSPDTSLVLLDQSESLSKKLDFADGLGNSYNNRAIIFTVQGKFDQALEYYEKALEQFERNHDFEGVGFCLGNIAICYEYQSLFDSALIFNHRALVVRQKYGFKKGVAQTNINIGVLYFNKGFYRMALQHYQAALDFYENKPEKTAIDKSYLGSIQNNIGNIYVEMKKPELARKYLLEALETYSGVADSREMAYLYNDLGLMEKLSDNHKNAKKYFSDALRYARNSGDKLIEVNVLQQIANNYLDSGQPDSARYFANLGLKESAGISDKKYAVGLHYTLGKTLMKTGSYADALSDFRKALALADEAEIIKEKDEVLKEMSDCYQKLGDLKSALDYLKLHIQAANSVMNIETHRQIAEMEAIYENEKKNRQLEVKEAENHLLQQDNELQKIRISSKNKLLFSITTGLILITLTLFWLFLEYQRKNAAYHALYLKNMEMSKSQAIKRKKDTLKNGDLFEEIERRMSTEKLFKQKDLSREILSDLLDTNREYVQQAIKDHADKTVGDYITGWRLEEAKEILSDPTKHKGKTMLQISDEIGLSATSTTTFYALFKKYTKMTPIQFKKHSKTKS